MRIAVIGPYSQGALRNWLKEVTQELNFWEDHGAGPAYLVPDVLELEGEEFQTLKENTKEHWAFDLQELKAGNIQDQISLVQGILNKRMAGDENSRTQPRKLFDFKIPFSNLSEFDFHFDGEYPSERVTEQLGHVATAVRLHAFYQYMIRICYPLYQGRNLDWNFRYATCKNGVDTFDFLFRIRMQEDSYTETTQNEFFCSVCSTNSCETEIQLNRLRSNKYCTLKRQNLSLLNGLCYEVDTESHGWRHRRTRFIVTEFNFVGEAGADAGGPRREYMTQVASEIYNKLKLFVKSPNSEHNVGEERDKWVPNPKANSLADMDNFYKVGFAMAIALKHGDCFELSLPSCFWKYLLGGKLEWDDIKQININQHVCIEKIATMQEEDIEYLEQKISIFEWVYSSCNLPSGWKRIRHRSGRKTNQADS